MQREGISNKKRGFKIQARMLALHFLLGIHLLGSLAYAAYPDKPVKFVVSFAPGGPVDIAARIVGARLSETLKQSVIIDNKTGAGGNVAAQLIAKAPSDGYTFLLTSSAYAVNPSLYGEKAGYNPSKDFIPVIVIATQPNVVSVNDKVPVKTLADLKMMATKEKMAYSSPGSGTTPHLTCENLFHVIWKSDVTHIPYRGAGPASIAVVGGETPIGCTAVAGILQFHKQGKVRILGVSSTERLPELPEVPTLMELGYPQIQDYTWVAVFAPMGTSSEITQQMNSAIQKTLAEPEIKEKLNAVGLIPVGGSMAQTSSYISSELKRWNKIVIDTKAKPE